MEQTVEITLLIFCLVFAGGLICYRLSGICAGVALTGTLPEDKSEN
jgi:hypothetical protein